MDADHQYDCESFRAKASNISPLKPRADNGQYPTQASYRYQRPQSRLVISQPVRARTDLVNFRITLVFGVDLSFLVRREADGDEVSPDAVPRVLELCLKEIERRGLRESGICKCREHF